MERVRLHAKTMAVQEAVHRAVTECIREGILSDFLSRNRAEVIAVSIFEYDEERELALMRKAIAQIADELERDEETIERVIRGMEEKTDTVY